ncbi:DNA-packaging protein [Mesorhizobium sp. M2D.F.Ca.ET.223.01.1.1]|uniref:DNA-packaging protein n=1 Tax=Mesorhizobium sp. M2D.F.Ca.ET.223.01.1.1 TaxID=2563940 RepID=UPI001092E7DC|nr:DNA-packaging protein [Mesorhizobium sp. M2D.F.Ca.ET.223.01.1.1]TGR83582.1 DNA-packaging protein [Mesorhizobium sp. M2D.F.Ca.ET.223.01.1.1]TGT75185.1 DNA-packaging protein [bacterium M00.F.Ca.ET.159.01.1.1]TGT88052.1 DNA-packaging protein [bacterium M00.F.Ca.ET.157.01.1.1]
MTAPLGNRFWEARSSHGRAPIFATPDDLFVACCEYFDWVEANPLYEAKAFAYQGDVTIKELPKMRAMTIMGLCIFLDISRATWDNYRQRQDFLAITTRAEDIIRAQKFEGAAAELLNANIIARDLGLADKTELTGKDGSPLMPTINASFSSD